MTPDPIRSALEPTWRVGRQVPKNVYVGDEIAAQFQREEWAAQAVAAVNALATEAVGAVPREAEELLAGQMPEELRLKMGRVVAGIIFDERWDDLSEGDQGTALQAAEAAAITFADTLATPPANEEASGKGVSREADEPSITESSGDIWADLGLPKPSEEEFEAWKAKNAEPERIQDFPQLASSAPALAGENVEAVAWRWPINPVYGRGAFEYTEHEAYANYAKERGWSPEALVPASALSRLQAPKDGADALVARNAELEAELQDALEEIDAAWAVLGREGNRGHLSLAEQITCVAGELEAKGDQLRAAIEARLAAFAAERAEALQQIEYLKKLDHIHLQALNDANAHLAGHPSGSAAEGAAK